MRVSIEVEPNSVGLVMVPEILKKITISVYMAVIIQWSYVPERPRSRG
jgi:hypothetical protein